MKIAQSRTTLRSRSPRLTAARSGSWPTSRMRWSSRATSHVVRRRRHAHAGHASSPARPGPAAGSTPAEIRSRERTCRCCTKSRRRADAFDVMHFHIDMLHFPLFEEIAPKTLTTLHGRLDIADLPDTYRRWSGFPLVSISNHQRLPMPEVELARHRAPRGRSARPALYAERPRADYLAFLGRISPEKRPDRAIEIAKAARRAAAHRGQGRRGGPGLFRDARSAAARPPAGRVHRRDRRRAEGRLPRQRARAAVPDRLARAFRAGDDRGDGLRHAGHRLALRLGPGSHR